MNALSIFNRMRNPKYCGDLYEPVFSPGSLFTPFLSRYEDSYRMLHEKDGQYTLSFDVPGVSKEDLNIEVDNNTLVVATVSKETEEQSERTAHTTRQYRFCTSIPEDVDRENITAEMEHGVLTVHLPISESAAPKKISIQ